MVPISSVLTMIFTLIITLVGPLVVLIVYSLKNKQQGIWSAWGLGAVGFFVMQMIIRTPILTILSLTEGFEEFAANNYLIYGLLLAFTAALFELVGRYVVAKVFLKNITFKRSVAAGLGHGGIESMALVGMTYVSNLLYTFLINSGSFDITINQVAASGMDTTPYLELKNTLIEAPSYLYLLGAYERVLTMIAHLAMTLIVCYFIYKKQDFKGILICLGMHTLIDLGAVLLPYYFPTNGAGKSLGYIIIYSFLTLVAVVSIWIIVRISKDFATVPQE